MSKKKIVKAPKGESLLVELLTEELPPKSLKRLSEAFTNGIVEGLKEKHFIGADVTAESFATPRRLAVRVDGVLAKQADRVVERKGPSVQAGLDANGQPTQALLGFARSCSADVAKLERRKDDKGEYFVYQLHQKGEPLANHLAAAVEASLKKLPVPKLMRWGSGEAQFVRPVHGVILLHGSKVVPGTVLGLKSGNKTLGHRFLSKGAVTIKRATDYEKTLHSQGKVVASFEERRDSIEESIRSFEKSNGVWVLEDMERVVGGKMKGAAGDDLLDEVTAIVEYPVVLQGIFGLDFLDVPVECLTLSMKQHQRYFPVFAAESGDLTNSFLVVSNIKPGRPDNIGHGNERVLRARLADAKFFYYQDRKRKLKERVPQLAKVVYHNKLGSQLERVQRLVGLAAAIAQTLHADVQTAERAAFLSKADLLTEMVGEFPELQGVMGRYYAQYDGEVSQVAEAIEQHYWPRGAGGELPESDVAMAVALADKLDTLVGMFGIGLAPTGEKDPFGLRRAAVGVLRILIEKSLPVNVMELFEQTGALFPGVVAADVSMNLYRFFMDRLPPYLRERGYAPDEIEAVLALNPTRLDQVLPRLDAVKRFRALPEGMALAAANKRTRNILRQAAAANIVQVHFVNDRIELRRENDVGIHLDETLLKEDAERKLNSELRSAAVVTRLELADCHYAEALKRLAALRPTVDDFFDKVMVMVDDPVVRDNRLALLKDLGNLFLNIADVSRLQG